MIQRQRVLFDVWADIDYLHYQWLKGEVDNAEFSEALRGLLHELLNKAKEERR